MFWSESRLLPASFTVSEIQAMIKVTYRAKFSHLIYFSWYHLIRSPVLLIPMYLLSCFITYQALPQGYSTVVLIISFVIMSLIVFSVMLALIFPFAGILTRISGKNKTFLTETSIELHDDHFVSESQYERSVFKWDIVQKLRRTKSFIIVYLSQTGAMLIPKKAFLSDDDWHSFYHFLRTHCNASAII